MAVTKIHGIKTTIDKAIEYICNPEKTDENIYISSFACSPQTAALDFKYTLDHTSEHSNENKAFHLIQAFEPGEITYENAHYIGKELADKLLEGKYSYILTTHIDKEHIHNHIIFCAADNINHKHYHDCKKKYWRIRTLNDQLCLEHGLSVIIPSGKRAKKYNEWNLSANSQDIKSQIRKDINHFIKIASTYEEFLSLMQAIGYEIKNSSFDNNSGKYISFRPAGKERFIRGSSKSLGSHYTKEHIKDRIETARKTNLLNPKSTDKIKRIITTDIRPDLINNPAFQKWIEKENLKTASKTYNQIISKNIRNLKELTENLNTMQTLIHTVKSEISSIDKEIHELSEIIKYAEQYENNKSFYNKYQRASNQENIFRKYETQIILFTGAEHMLQNIGMNPEHINTHKLHTQYQELIQKRKQLKTKQSTLESELNHIQLLNENINEYLNLPVTPLKKTSNSHSKKHTR